MTANKLSKLVIKALEKLKAVDVKILDVKQLTSITDVMIIASGTSNRQVSALANKVIEELLLTGYLNDLDFAKQFTDEKIKTKLWGKNKIKSELVKKGIRTEIVTQILNESFNDDDEYEKAMVTAEKKFRTLKPKLDDEIELKRKLIYFLNMRGYSYEISGKVCDELIGEEDHFD